MRVFLAVAMLIASITAAIWGFGIRIVVFKPIGAIPEGRTVIMYGVPGLWLIDSPDAMCIRTQGYVNLICRGAALVAIGDAGKDKILVRFPYSHTLDALVEQRAEAETRQKR